MLDAFLFAVHITAPVFAILVLGIIFKWIGLINDEFARIGSGLVFNVTLPCLLFVKIVEADFHHGLPLTLVGYALLATVLVFLLLDRVLTKFIVSPGARGVFVQGAYRSNMGITGLAYCLSAFGEGVVGIASIYLAVMTTLFNVLAVITLSRHREQDMEQRTQVAVLRGIAGNPLILSILTAAVIALSAVEVPQIILHTGGYFAQMTLPLALLCAGASIRLREFQTSKSLYWATGGKLFFVPLLITLGGILVGLRGASLGVLFLMSGSPTAAASYPMAQALGGNHHLAAAIIAATSLGSVISSTLGVFVLRAMGLI